MSLKYSEKTPIGSEAWEFSLKGTDGKTYTLSDFKDKKGLLIIFTCNHCPYAQSSWPELIKLYGMFGNNIDFAAINPNDDELYPEDSFEEMQRLEKEININFPYLRDDTQEIARAYNAQCTPDLYLYKNDGGTFKLYYHGRINDNWKNPDRANKNNLKDAIEGLLAELDPPSDQPPSMGCSIKWK